MKKKVDVVIPITHNATLTAQKLKNRNNKNNRETKNQVNANSMCCLTDSKIKGNATLLFKRKQITQNPTHRAWTYPTSW